jgi:tRNA 2-thiouridine synthesizing protein A
MHEIHGPSRLEVSARLVDARGRACPLPIVDLARALKTDEVVELWADDPAASQDVVAFCQATGGTLLSVSAEPCFRGVIKRRA